MIRDANVADLEFLRGLSPRLSDEQLRTHIRDGRIRIIEPAEVPVGFIKFYVLWETLPFMEFMIIREDSRGRGLGRRAVREWEKELVGRSFRRALVSTQANETARGFWRRVGYSECGSLRLPNDDIELFMFRDFATTAA